MHAAQVELGAVGMMLANRRGTQIPNPPINLIDALERSKLVVIRSL